MKWTEKELISFVIEAGKETYLSDTSKKLPSPYRPGCEEYLYKKGSWKYLDSYAWHKDGGGSEIVYHQDIPVWTLNYYGHLLNGVDAKSIYTFLHRALARRHPELPVRGATLIDDLENMRYEIEFSKKTIGAFSGIERIYKNEKPVYECYVHGGFIK